MWNSLVHSLFGNTERWRRGRHHRLTHGICIVRFPSQRWPIQPSLHLQAPAPARAGEGSGKQKKSLRSGPSVAGDTKGPSLIYVHLDDHASTSRPDPGERRTTW